MLTKKKTNFIYLCFLLKAKVFPAEEKLSRKIEGITKFSLNKLYFLFSIFTA